MPVRYDRAIINDVKQTEEGYLTISACPITRPGVFPYRRNDGGINMEAKLPEELFSEKTIQSANAKPITNGHPSEPVTASNYNKYAKGMTHTDSSVKDNKLIVSFTVTDPDTIKAVNDGKRELSIGFQADVKDEKGVYDGMQYDSVQRNMQINHIAIVDEGRAGPEVAIRGDSVAFMIDSKENDKGTGGNKMPVLKIDNKDYEVDPVVKANYDKMQAKVDAAEQKASSVETVTGQRDALQAQVDSLNEKLKTAEENTLTADELDKKVQARIQLVDTAKKFLGDSADLTGKNDRQVKEEVIKKMKADADLTKKSDEYVDAYFDSLNALTNDKGFTQSAVFNDAKDKNEQNSEEIEALKNKRLNLNKKEDK